MINNKLIKNITLLDNFKQIGQRLNDGQTKAYQLEYNHFYIMINSHPTNNALYFINSYDGSVSTIFESSKENLVFTFDKSNYLLSIRAKGTARGYLYDTGLSNG